MPINYVRVKIESEGRFKNLVLECLHHNEGATIFSVVVRSRLRGGASFQALGTVCLGLVPRQSWKNLIVTSGSCF